MPKVKKPPTPTANATIYFGSLAAPLSAACKQDGLTRSELVRELVREWLAARAMKGAP